MDDATEAIMRASDKNREAVREAMTSKPPTPSTVAGRALLDDYYSDNDARKGVGYSLGRRIAAIEQEASNAQFERVLATFIVENFPKGTSDWACVECHPDSVMLEVGFQCIPHACRSLLSDNDSEGERRFTIPIDPDPISARLRGEKR